MSFRKESSISKQPEKKEIITYCGTITLNVNSCYFLITAFRHIIKQDISISWISGADIYRMNYKDQNDFESPANKTRLQDKMKSL